MDTRLDARLRAVIGAAVGQLIASSTQRPASSGAPYFARAVLNDQSWVINILKNQADLFCDMQAVNSSLSESRKQHYGVTLITQSLLCTDILQDMSSKKVQNLSTGPQHSFTIASILGRPSYNRVQASAENAFNALSDSSSTPSPSKQIILDDIVNEYHGSSPQFAEAQRLSSQCTEQEMVPSLNWNLCNAENHQHNQSTPSSGNKCSSLIGRSPRVPFTRDQVEGLETKFRMTNYLSSREVSMLASQLKVTETRVKIWFQNRRARQRRESYIGDIVQGQPVHPITLSHEKAQQFTHSNAFYQAPHLANLVPANSFRFPFNLDTFSLAGSTNPNEVPQHPVHELATLYRRHFHENLL